MQNTMLATLALTVLLAGCEDPADDVPAAEVVETEPAEDPAAPDEAPEEVEAASSDSPATMPAGALAIDTANSTFGFIGAKVSGSDPGHFDEWSGHVVLGDPIEQSRVSVTIQMASVQTDRGGRLTTHLLSDDFFDVANHPTAVFETVSFGPPPEDAGEATHTVTARLTLVGTTQTIRFPVQLEVSEQEVRARAEFSIDRQRWGIAYPGMVDDLIRDQVVIRFDIRAPRG